MDENICQHCPVAADPPAITMDPHLDIHPTVETGGGNRFEDRCRVNFGEGRFCQQNFDVRPSRQGWGNRLKIGGGLT